MDKNNNTTSNNNNNNLSLCLTQPQPSSINHKINKPLPFFSQKKN